MTPDSEEALAEAMRSANSSFNVSGGGTRGVGTEGEKLSTKAMSGITLYEPGALTIVAQAGTPVADIETALAAEGQRLAFEPIDYRFLLKTNGAPTIGGVVATNASGPRRIQGGAARDYALGVRFVDGAGRIIKNGGRVMKNVTGYDLVKLMAGSYGTLGVLTEVSLKVLPVSETQKTLVMRGNDDAAAIALLSKAMQSPYEVTGAAHCPIEPGEEPVTLLRLEGFETSVDYRINALKDQFAQQVIDIHVAEVDTSEEIWQTVRDVRHMSDVPGDIWRVSCKPSDAAMLARCSGALEWYFDWAGGLIWFRTDEGADLRAKLGRFDGHATLVRASAETRSKLPRFSPPPDGVARLTKGLHARFDPRGILNPGLMGTRLREMV